MLGKYRQIDFVTNGTGEPDSYIAIKGGLNEHRLGSANTGYSRLDDPFIPFVTVDIDFDTSPFFGNMMRLINIPPREYRPYLESLLSSRYQVYVNESVDTSNGITLSPCAYNLDMGYMMPNITGGNISAAEWLYMKLYGVPSLDEQIDTSDLNAPAAEPQMDNYDEDIERINDEIRQLQNMLNGADFYDTEKIKEQIADLEEARANQIYAQNIAAASAIKVTPTDNPTIAVSQSNDILDNRLNDFIRSCKMFYELIRNHAYMITSIDLGDILTAYYQNDNNMLNGAFNLRFGETVDLKTSRMMHGFMNAMYDSIYMREFIPGNLRSFNMTIYIHDARSFFNNTPAGQMLLRAKDNNKLSQINALAAEHTATIAICLMGCKFVSYTNNFNSITMAGPAVGPSQDVIDVSISFDMCKVYMTDIHDLTYGK